MSRRLYRAKAGADGQHSDLFGLLLCVRPGARCRDAGRDALRARSGNGRRVERPGQRSLPKVGPPSFGPKAISIVQSSWALGFAAAALVPGPVARSCGWRAVFFAGILPAAVTLWIQRSVPESRCGRSVGVSHGRPMWPTAGNSVKSTPVGLLDLFLPPYGKHTIWLLLFNFFGLFA
jgi:hypothetical protein